MRFDARVVVGVDGSTGAMVALDWAAREAVIHSVPLCVVHCPDSRHGSWPGPQHDTARTAAEILQVAVERATGKHPRLSIHGELVAELPRIGLVRIASDARILVVGASGRARSNGLLGSTALSVAEHANCPVAVIRPEKPQYGALCDHIVVGVDGSPASQAALEFAFAEANARQAPLAVVHVPTYDALEREFATSAYDIFTEKPSHALISAMVHTVAPRHPTVVVVERVMGRSPCKDLARISVGAKMLVVGERGRGGFAGMLLGSVSHAMMRRASCPVVVVPPVSGDRELISRRAAARFVGC